ncbi:hypothetical protein NS506_03119 [Nocardia seriolae]|uniref:Uncharacterized protein n=1 Tax=Nocardia seriolae TaxID=37332 RepID=A0ABC8AST0_9NOCA|nr:hypothetical protein NS506_03119 [Nocardia seriolae]BEK86755.1 hypothetical protein NSERKGN1266_27060 [Nocardia seriolae]
MPHREHSWLEGKNRSTVPKYRLCRAAFSATIRVNIAHPASCTDFANLVRARPFTLRSSTNTAWLSRMIIVECDGGDQRGALGDVLPEGVDAHHVQAVVERAEQDDREQGAADGALAHLLLDGRRPHPQRLDILLRQLPFRTAAHESPAPQSIQHGERDIVAHPAVQQQRLRLAFLGRVTHSGPDHVARLAQPHPLAVDPHLAGADRQVTRERAGQFGAARADQPGRRHHFTGAHLQAHIGHVVGGDVIHLQQDRPELGMLAREHRRQIAADHHPHDLLIVGVGGVAHPDQRAVAQHRHPIGQLEDLTHAVRDVDDGQAAVAQAADQREQRFGLVIRERGGGFVEGDHLRLGGQRPHDLHQLALGRGQFRAEGVRIQVPAEAEPIQIGAHTGPQRRPIQQAARTAR